MPASANAGGTLEESPPPQWVRLVDGRVNLCRRLARELKSFRYSTLEVEIGSITRLVEAALRMAGSCPRDCGLVYAVARGRDYLSGLGIVMRRNGESVEAQFCAVDFALSQARPLSPVEAPRHWPEAPRLVVPDRAKGLIA